MGELLKKIKGIKVNLKELLDLAEEKGLSREELKKKLYEAHTRSIGDSAMPSLEELSNLPESEHELQEGVVQEFYLSYLSDGSLGELTFLGNEIGIEPSDTIKDLVIEKFLDELKEGNLYNIKELGKFVRSEIEIPEETINKIQENYLTYAKNGRTDYLLELRKASGVALSEEVVQEIQQIYARHLKEDDLKSFTVLWWGSGVKPSLPEESVQGKYRKYLKESKRNDFENLLRATGIKPLFSYEEIYEIYSSYEGNLKHIDFKFVEKMMGISPPDEVIQKEYVRLVREGAILWFELLLKEGWGSPSFPDEVVHEGYLTLINKGLLGSLGDLKRITGVEPSSSEDVVNLVQKKHAEYSEKGGPYNSADLIIATGINPLNQN